MKNKTPHTLLVTSLTLFAFSAYADTYRISPSAVKVNDSTNAEEDFSLTFLGEAADGDIFNEPLAEGNLSDYPVNSQQITPIKNKSTFSVTEQDIGYTNSNLGYVSDFSIAAKTGWGLPAKKSIKTIKKDCSKVDPKWSTCKFTVTDENVTYEFQIEHATALAKK